MLLLPCLRTAVLVTIALSAAGSRASDGPIPKVMSDAPQDKGAWRMEILEAPGRDSAQAGAMSGMGGSMTVCRSAAEALARDRAPPAAGKGVPACTRKLLEDGATRAVMETTCPGTPPMVMKSTIVRVAPRSYELSTESTGTGAPGVMKMRMKMSYAGACSASDAAVKMDKSSEICTESKTMLAQMDPAKCPKGQGNAACVQQMTTARTQIESMCK